MVGSDFSNVGWCLNGIPHEWSYLRRYMDWRHNHQPEKLGGVIYLAFAGWYTCEMRMNE